MAGHLKRRWADVDYRETSSGDEFDESGQDNTPKKRRATPQRRSTRPRQYPVVPGDSAASFPPTPSSSKRSGQLRGRRRVSYRETSEDEDYEASEVEEAAPKVRARAKATRSPRKKDKKPKRARRDFGGPLKSKTVTRSPSPALISDGKIPNWASLPYHVLLQIFVYASHPLHDENFTPTPSISWLAKTARLCSAFAKPALTALYRNPPIFALRQNRIALVEHLATPQTGAYADYWVMTKRLELDATRMSKLTQPQTSVQSLAALISSLRTLRDIDIFDPFDKPPYRDVRDRLRRIRPWHYPDELFNALEQSELHLRSWHWNETYCSKGLLWMKDVHLTSTFQSLREVKLTRFQTDKKDPAEGAPTREDLLGSALAALPALKSLSFETCTLMFGRLLPLLSNSLVTLNITNCRSLLSDDLQAFLTTHGSRLEELVLNHNQSLDLAFLTSLKRDCPRLEVLRMDLNYYSTLAMSSDNEPIYHALLEEGEIPSWPTTLTTIDMEYLRHWTSNAAVAFFTSLIESAKDLPMLRDITITAIVDIEWRQRAEFRQNWTKRFQKVFARPFTPPNPHLASFRAFREAGQSQISSKPKAFDNVETSPAKEIVVPSDSESESDSDAPLSRRRKPRIVKQTFDTKVLRSRGKAKYDETSGDEVGKSDGNASDAEDVPFVQGMCNTVLFRVDNSRPQETIYDERDFLDDEASGDEDWNGNDPVADEREVWL